MPDSTPTPCPAREIVIDVHGAILIDGAPAPWIIARDRIDVAVDPDGGLSCVRLPILAENVRVIGTERRASDDA